MKSFLSSHWVKLLLIVVGAIAVVLVTKYDDQLYRQPIFEIQQVQTKSSTKITDDFNNPDTQTKQVLTGIVTNGKYRGKQLRINNTYSHSHGMDIKYHAGQKVFLNYHVHPKFHATIKNLKRDTVVVFLGYLVIVLLLVLLKRSGLLTLISIVINSILFIGAIQLNRLTNGGPVIVIFSILAVVFCVITLGLVLGFNRQTWITLCAALGGTIYALLLSWLVFIITKEKGVYYESMEFVTQLPKPLLATEILIGVLGAVMDEATDIVASLFALKQENPQITTKQIFDSGRKIGSSIMGPLINVLFFVFMGETLPMTLLFLKNGNSWGYSFSMNMSLGMISSLISAIGIVMTVLLASLFTSLWLKGQTKWEP